MTKLDTAKQVIKKFYHLASCGIFNIRNFTGDPMSTIYCDGELQIDMCYYYSYFEVFGLSASDFDELSKFYDCLAQNKEET